MASYKVFEDPQQNPLICPDSPFLDQSSTTTATMKTSIPSEVWENKRAEIATLYKEEEWPLKQVIKKIRSDDFNPTETQLRSRLKKWGVTKPSRQKRKKQGEGPTPCPTIKHPGRLELTTMNEHSTSQATSFSDRLAWNDMKGWAVTPGYSQSPMLKNSSFLEGQRLATDWSSSNNMLNDNQCGSHPPYSLQHFTTPSPLSSINSFGHQHPATSSMVRNAVNAPISCNTGFATSGTPISSSDSFVKTYSNEWASQASPMNTESSPLTPWSYGNSDVSQSCGPNFLSMNEGSPPSGDFIEYKDDLIPSDDYAQSYENTQPMSPNADLDLIQLDPVIQHWRRAATTHVRPDGAGIISPRVGRHPLIRRRPEMRGKKGSSSSKQHLSTMQSNSNMATQHPSLPSLSVSIAENNSNCQTTEDRLTEQYAGLTT
ncbi:hypothetical protein AJ79_05504 [Helicocarpus griseus UAMH5409]|uniref:Clr5 domain-containing protein n=1 Tax=Helicocarpus griseus UAMH5409 TaxID=1447875 RepID=A0A2B7XMF6_9EURO|nr:hypothetical protein AJ79_05504 [Helicocarpus griseus UAMH5409]